MKNLFPAGEVQREVRKMIITDNSAVHAKRNHARTDASFDTPPPGTDGQHVSETCDARTIIPELDGAHTVLDSELVLPDAPKTKPSRSLIYQLSEDNETANPAAFALAEKLHNEGLLKAPRPAKFNDDGSLEIIIGAPGSRSLPKLP